MTEREYRELQKEVGRLYRKRIAHKFEEGDFERYQELTDRLCVETKSREKY
jgi:hypothetical protein